MALHQQKSREPWCRHDACRRPDVVDVPKGVRGREVQRLRALQRRILRELTAEHWIT